MKKNKNEENIPEEDLCQGCKLVKGESPHTCPYAEELWGNDSECNCCDECTHQCAMDI